MNIYIRLYLLILLSLPGLAVCADIETDFFHIERSKKNDLDIQVTSIGGFGLNKGSVGHMDLSYIESVENGDTLAIDLGGGVSVNAGATFFLGVGFLLGYNNKDNNAIGAYYPQVGVIVHISKTLGLIATGRRYSNLHSNIEDENIVMFGFLLGSYQ